MSSTTPPLVTAALDRAGDFAHSCDPAVGRLLAALAAHVPQDGRVLELGTGVGVGLAWLASGLLPRTDATVTTVESDAERAARTATGDWPPFVRLLTGDALELLPGLGTFDLVFADAVAGKQVGLDLTIAALNPRGMLVVDDMLPAPGAVWDDEFAARQDAVRRRLLTHERLVAVELPHGVVLATAR
ncbi:SAM-dependent methyltransferase [Nonomuraea phyllanthi]|uniref:O-methyltransferase n=1 Tax=Nonomuraea phyllanthi TaxID=2219224 RepID=UPI001293A192|nr:class I SAM-dependent methyltransferase [Nonomuraea phyllanthi]QFY13615.1 SAM-dependent methyltransferase [Nonomuraea phyllanthi]